MMHAERFASSRIGGIQESIPPLREFPQTRILALQTKAAFL